MRKLFSFAVFLAIFVAVPAWCSAGQYDFRKTRWGMSREEVKISEKHEIIYEDNDAIIYFPVLMFGEAYGIGYFFNENQLIRAGYELKKQNLNETVLMANYNSFIETLRSKFGTPEKENEIWDKFAKSKYKPKHWGQAVIDGVLTKKAIWISFSSLILTSCEKAGSNIVLRIEYYDKKQIDTKIFKSKQPLINK